MIVRRRVALLLTTPGWRGSGVSFLKIATGLARAGHEVVLIAGDDEVAARFAPAGLPVELVPTGDTGRREVAAVRRLLATRHIEVVLADAPRDVRIARYASLLTRRRILWRYNLHGRRLATDILQRWLFGGVALVVHQSRHGAARLAADTPWLRQLPSTIVPNGFDPDALLPDSARGLAFRHRHGIADDGALVVTPTGAAPEKALDVARAAVGRLGRGRPVTWAVAADGAPNGEDGLRVVSLGRLEPEALHDAIRAADVVLLPAPGELFNNVAAEAMALGAVVAGADAGATPEVIGEAGVLFRAGDATDAARIVAALLDDPGRRAALGRAARERIRTVFPLAEMARGYDALVREER